MWSKDATRTVLLAFCILFWIGLLMLIALALNEPCTHPPASITLDRASHKVGPHGVDVEKREHIKRMMQHAWNGYRTHAWGQDELHPVDGTSSNWLGLGLTIVDSLDTLWIMGLRHEFNEARRWVASHLHFDTDRSVSLFETNIRILGGLLSAYDLSGDSMFLNKATDLGDRFLDAFDPSTGFPACNVNLGKRTGVCASFMDGMRLLSQIGTLQLEFVHLSNRTHNPKYANAALRVYEILDGLHKQDGLYSVYVHPTEGFKRDVVSVGALGDSFYEYLMKTWVMLGKPQGSRYQRMYVSAVRAIQGHLVRNSSHASIYIASRIRKKLVPQMGHLACFAGAMFVEGARQGIHSTPAETERFMNLGVEVTETCHKFYNWSKSNISPERVQFMCGGASTPSDFFATQSNFVLRPEAVESYFVLWRHTHHQRYRDWGWEYAQAVESHCKVRYGYSGIRNVNAAVAEHDNLMQSFFLAESLKYLYLLFSDDTLISMDDYVFNTECHPLRIV